MSSEPGERTDATSVSERSVHPRVSIILRTRNRSDLLGRALRDIGRQTFTDYEVVVVNDGDDDSPADVIAAASGSLRGSIRLIDRLIAARGRPAAANVGLRSARGEFVVVHDDDDSWDQLFLETTVGFMESHPTAVAVASHTEVWVETSGGPEPVERIPLTPDLTRITSADMLRANRIAPIALLYRTSVHGTIGYLDESLVVQEDWNFYLRLLATHPIHLLPPPALAHWHHRPDAVGADSNSVFADGDKHDRSSGIFADGMLRRAATGQDVPLFLAFVAAQSEDSIQRRVASAEEEWRRTVAPVAERLGKLEAEVEGLHRSLEDAMRIVAAATESVSSELRSIRYDIFSRTSITNRFRAVREKIAARRRR